MMERKAGGVLQAGYQEEKEPFLQSLKCRMANETSEDIHNIQKCGLILKGRTGRGGYWKRGMVSTYHYLSYLALDNCVSHSIFSYNDGSLVSVSFVDLLSVVNCVICM